MLYSTVHFVASPVLAAEPGQVYPDGVETEQTSGYDAMSAGNFYSVLQTLEQAGKAAPSAYAKAVENMYNYIAFSVRAAW